LTLAHSFRIIPADIEVREGDPVASITSSEYIETASIESQRDHVEQAILIPTIRLRLPDLERFRNAPFDNMIKFAVDVRLRKIALGGEMHADAEEVLLRAGSDQADVWGGENLWPWGQPPRIEYISLINIRPAVDNRAMDIRLEHIRAAAENIVHEWVDLH
jgi:hypothetical protein